MMNYGYVLWPNLVNNSKYDAYIDGFEIEVNYTTRKISIGPGRALIDGNYTEYSATEYTFSPDHKWAAIWIDPSDMSLKITEGQEETPACVDPSVKATCYRPKAPVVNGYTIALVPLWQ